MGTEIQELSAREREVLYLIYQLEPATVQDIQEGLKKKSASYNSVRRTIDCLVEKGFVSFQRVGRKHQFRPIRSRTEQGTKLLREVIKAFFDESPALGFANLIRGTRSEQVQDLEIENIRRLVDKFRSGDDETPE